VGDPPATMQIHTALVFDVTEALQIIGCFAGKVARGDVAFQIEYRSVGIPDFSITGNRIGIYVNRTMMSSKTCLQCLRISNAV
jgi:hypothetical protein